MRNDYDQHKIESFVKTLIIGGLLGSAITIMIQMFS